MKILSDQDIEEIKNHFKDKRISQNTVIAYLENIYPSLFFSTSESQTKKHLTESLGVDQVRGKALSCKQNMSFTIDRGKETFRVTINENTVFNNSEAKTYTVIIL